MPVSATPPIFLYMASAGFRIQTVGRITIEGTKIWRRPDGQFRIAIHIRAEKTSLLVITGDRDPSLAY